MIWRCRTTGFYSECNVRPHITSRATSGRWSGADRRPRPDRSPAHRSRRTDRSGDASPGRSRRSHTARFRSDEVTVHYRFHPLAGIPVRFYRRHRFPEQTILIVERPDGSIVHVPEWMTLPAAAEIALEDRPRLSLQALSELRASIEALVVALSASTNGECDGTDTGAAARESVRPGEPSPAHGPHGDAAASRGADHGSDDDMPANNASGRR